MKTTAIATIPKSVQPKPSKAEIIEALVVLKMTELDAAKDKAEAHAKTLEDEASRALAAFVVKNPSMCIVSHDTGYVDAGKIHGLRVEFRIADKDITPNLRKMVLEARAADTAIPRKKGADQIRKEIVEGLKPVVNPQRLLDDKETRGVLSDLLKKLNG